MNPSGTPSVCVVILTYGDRWRYLAQVLAAVAGQEIPVQRLVLVDNGSEYPLGERLAALTGLPGYELIDLGGNRGSAVGYKAGLAAAKGTDCEFFWMLDDDNRPAPSALARLMAAREGLGSQTDHLFACYRADREKYVRALFRNDPITIGDPDSFMGFRVDKTFAMLKRRLDRRKPAATTPIPVKEIGYAVYGGLLLHRKWIDIAGFPDETYFLYMDDREYTARLAAKGARIFLVEDSVVEDLEVAWNVGTGKPLPMLDTSTSELKAYYTVRNQVAFEKKHLVRNPFVYSINRRVFTLILFVRAFLINKSLFATLHRLRLFTRSVHDGLHGRMGRRDL